MSFLNLGGIVMPIRIVAIRHGKPLSAGYAEDSLRPLSEEGRNATHELLQKLEIMALIPALILTSPLLRARQTAEVASAYFNAPLEDEPALGDEFDQDVLLEKLRSSSDAPTIFLVGHAPTLAKFISHLAGKAVLPKGMVQSGAAIIEFDGAPAFGAGRLIDYITPEQNYA